MPNFLSKVRNLQQRKGRKRTGLTLAEGVRLVEEAVATGVTIQGVVASETLGITERGAALWRRLASQAVSVQEVDDETLAGLAATDTPQGVIAIIEQPRFDLAAIDVQPRAPVLVLDEVQDPGNVGALVRTALALGASGVVLLPGSGDVNNPKALRAAVGASFRIPTVRASTDELRAWAAASGVEIWVADTQAVPLPRVKMSGKVALVVGNEGAGVGPAVRELAGRRVAIPLARGAESLNVAVAAGILLHEVQRAD